MTYVMWWPAKEDDMGRYTYNVSTKGGGGVPGLLTDANRGEGGLGHVTAFDTKEK